MSSNSRVGKDAYIKFGSTELQTEFRTFTWGETKAFVDGSSGSDTHVRHLSTLTDMNLTLEMVGLEGTAGTAAWAALAPGTSGTLEYGPDGTATGMPKRVVLAEVEGREESTPYTDVVTWNITWKQKGTPDYTPY